MRVFALMSKKLKNYKKTRFIQIIFAKENTKLKKLNFLQQFYDIQWFPSD